VPRGYSVKAYTLRVYVIAKKIMVLEGLDFASPERIIYLAVRIRQRENKG
jgi:hypothetical protein